MRVLFLAERFPPDRGGAAASAGRQAQSLAGRLDRLDVLHLVSDLPPASVALEERPPVHVWRVGRGSQPDESLQILLRTALNLQGAHRHDLVHGFYAVHAGYVGTLAARLASIPCVVSLRGNDVERAMFHGPRLPFLLWTLERADALLSVSAEICGRVRALTGREAGLHVVPNGVDGLVFRPDGPAPKEPAAGGEAPRPWIAFSGELRLKKGMPVLLELAGRLAREGRGTLFLLGGARREEQGELDAWRRESPRAAARVRVVPWISDPEKLAALYRAMDLVVFPSLWEGLPNALLEAMACGRPVLATAVGACPEVIEDGVTGFLVAPSMLDAFPERALGVLDSDPRVLARVGSAARERVERDFSPWAERDAILRVYGTLRP